MREFLDRLNIRIAEAMQGRYGMDSLNKVLLIVGLIILLFGQPLRPFDMIGIVFVAIAIFRMLSTNIDKRNSENKKFLKIFKTPSNFVKKQNTK